MSMMKNGKKVFIPAVAMGVVFCAAFGMSYLAGQLQLSDADLQSAVSGVQAVKAESIQDEDGRFVILDYPSDLDLSSYVTLGDYTAIELETEAPGPVTDEAIDANIESYVTYYGRYYYSFDVIEEGDIVTVSYTGYLDGKAQDAYTATDNVTLLDSSVFPQSFVDNLVGTYPGTEQSFSMTFPDDWSDSAYAGKTLDFKVTVKCVDEIPELTDESVVYITNGEFDTADAFREYVARQIEAYDESIYESEVSSEILSKVMDQATFSTPPEELLDWYVSMQMRFFQDEADSANLSVEDYVVSSGTADSLEDLLYTLTVAGQEAVKSYAALDVIAAEQDITVDAEADADSIEQRSEQLIDGLGLADEDTLMTYYKESNLYHDVQNWKVFDWLREVLC